MVSENGELLCTMIPENSGDADLVYISKTPEGLPVFALRDLGARGNIYFAYNQETGNMQVLGKGDYWKTMGTANITMDSYGSMYYLKDKQLVAWDTVSGKKEQVFNCQENEICNNGMAAIIGYNAAGDVVILDPHTQLDNIYVISRIAPDKQVEITLANLFGFGGELAKTTAAIYSRKTPGITISYEMYSGNTEEYRDRQIMDLSTGNGPDMLLVDSEDLQLLYEQDLLADLSDVFPEELKEQIFGGIWQAGTIDGKLVGLADQLYLQSVLVSNKVWTEDTWTVDDILQIMEEQEGTAQGIYPTNVYSPSHILNYLLTDMDSSLVDWEQGICYFDSEKFKKIMELCKAQGVLEGCHDSANRKEVKEAIENGAFLGTREYIMDFSDFSSYMAYYGEDYHWVGFPTDGESGNFGNCGGFLVVNKNTEHMKEIRGFLQLLYSEELQRSSHHCLRKDVLRENTFIPSWSSKAEFSMGEGRYLQLDCKPDGTSYVEEFIAFMDSGTIMPVKDAEICAIVTEEAEAYFAGDKDLDTVVDIIQGRVQLYLDESK